MIRSAFAGVLAGLSVGSLELARRIEGRRTVLERVARAERGPRRWPRPPSWALRCAVAVAAWLLGGALAGIVGSIAGVAGASAAPRWLRLREARRRERDVEERLPEAISVVAASMRSGRSLPQALEVAAGEVAEPLGPALARLVARVELGDPLEDAIEAWAAELAHPDVRLAAGVLRLHRRTGGALAGALEQLAATLRARRTAARELRSLTAQARLSATILGLLPIGFFLFMSVVARDDLRRALETPIGVWAIVVGISLQAAAYAWIRRLVRVEP